MATIILDPVDRLRGEWVLASGKLQGF